jgi:hypothetical protein
VRFGRLGVNAVLVLRRGLSGQPSQVFVSVADLHHHPLHLQLPAEILASIRRTTAPPMLTRADDTLRIKARNRLSTVAAGFIDALRMSSRSTHCRSFPGAAPIA